MTYTPTSFTNLTPSTISTSTAPYDATLSASGSNFNNVNQVTFSWSGAVSGSATWNKGDTDWNAKVTVNSDTSLTLRPRVVETNPTWSGTVYWTVTLRDTTGATASRSFTVTYTPTAPNHPPNPPTNLGQFKSDGTTQMPVGATISERNPIFKGYISDPDGDKVKLEIELRRVNEYAGSFKDLFTQKSDLINSNNQVDVAASGLIDDNYHWQARTVDEHGLGSAWVPFGNNPNLATDFSVRIDSPPIARFTYSPQYPEIGEAITFDASSSYDPDDGTISSYRWDFEDGIVKFGKTVSYIPQKTGGRLVFLTVTDDEGTEGGYFQTVNVFSRELNQSIEQLVGTAYTLRANVLASSKVNDPITNEPTTAADFFGKDVAHQEHGLIIEWISKAFGGLLSAFDVLEVRRISVLSIMKNLELKDNYPSWLVDILDDNGWIAAEVLLDANKEGLKAIAIDVTNKLMENNYSYYNTFYTSMETLNNDRTNKLNEIKSEVLSGIGSLTQAQIELYSEDIRKRNTANTAISGFYDIKSLLPNTYMQIKIDEASDWKMKLAKVSLWIGMTSGKIALSLMGAPPYLLWANSAFAGVLGKVDELETDSQMLFTSALVLSEGMGASDAIFRNTYEALENIRDRATPQTAKAEIVSIENFGMGPIGGPVHYNKWLSFWYIHVWSDVEVYNPGSYPTVYEVVVPYVYDLSTMNIFTVPINKYRLPTIISERKRIEPYDTKTIRIFYQKDNEGVDPGNMDIPMTLLGETDDGVYWLDKRSIRFGTTKIVTNDVNVSEEELENSVMYPHPVRSELENLSAGNYSLKIYIKNPFDFSIPAELIQEIPSDIEIISAEDGSIGIEDILWQFEAKPQERRKPVVIFRLKGNPLTVEIPPALLKIYDQVNAGWHVFPSNGVVIEPDICRIPKSPGATGQDHNDWIEPFNAYNSDDMYTYHSNTSPNGVGVELSWDGGASYTQAGKTASFSESENVYILGANNDTWGRIWSASELNNTNFRLRIYDGVAYQDYYNFDFELPSGAIIKGIEVTLEGYDDGSNDYVDQLKVRVYADHIYIPPSSPIAYFTASPKIGESPLRVQFSNNSIGEITNYLWDFGDDKTSTLENPTHIYELLGTYTVSLTVTGPHGSKTKTRTDYIEVVIPVVFGTIYKEEAGVKSPLEGATVAILNLSRTQTLASASTDSQGKFSITSDSISDGTYFIQASKDGYKSYTGMATLRNSQSLPFTATLVAYQPPMLNLIGDKTVNEGGLLEFRVSASDTDSSNLTFTHPQPAELPSGATFVDNGDGTATFSWTPNYTQGRSEPYNIHFEVSDGALTDSEDVNISVYTVLVFGTIYKEEAGVKSPLEGATISVLKIDRTPAPISPAFTDTEGKFAVVGTLPDGNYFIKTEKEGYVTYSGLTLLRNTQALPFSVTLYAPIMGALSDASLQENQPFTLTLSATDRNNDRLSFSATGLPEGANLQDNLNNTATFSWMPAHNQSGPHSVEFKVTDGLLSDSRSVILSVNTAPELASIGNKTIEVGKKLEFAVNATDKENDTLTFSAAGLPLGAAFDSQTRIFSWIPTGEQIGTYEISFTVSDGKLGDSETIAITVSKTNQKPHARIFAYPHSGRSPLRVRFVGARSFDPDGKIVSYLWNFGDGTNSNRPNSIHEYINTSSRWPRGYRANLTVTDDKGASSTAKVIIIVYPTRRVR